MSAGGGSPGLVRRGLAFLLAAAASGLLLLAPTPGISTAAAASICGGWLVLLAAWALWDWQRRDRIARLEAECDMLDERGGPGAVPEVLVIRDVGGLRVVTECVARVRLLDTRLSVPRGGKPMPFEAGDRHVCYGGAIAAELRKRGVKA